MAYPYALLRAGFRYEKALGGFTNTSFPHDVAIGQDGRFFVLCQGNSGPISILNLADDDLGSFGAPGFGFRLPSYKCNPGSDGWSIQDGAFLWPCQIIVDSDELLYVSDQAADRISVYNRFGEYLSKWGEHGSGDGQLDRPSGIAFDADENMCVVDTMNHRVQKFTKDGRFLAKFGSFGSGEGELDMPWGIHIDDIGDVYVVDWRNDRIQKFTAEGEFIFALGRSGDRDGELNRPAGVAVDSDGDIYVADTGNNRVQLFSEEGRYVEKFIGDATLSKSMINYMMPQATPLMLRELSRLEPQKRFRTPRSVVVDDQKRMYVAEFHSFRVQIYEKQAIPLSADQIAPRATSRKLKTI